MAVVIIATVMIPIITATTQTTTTTEIDNEGAGWLKLGYSSGNDFDFEITNENSNITIGDQTGTMGDNIFYADSKNVIFADSVQNAIFLLNTESSSVHKFSNTVSVENTGGTLNISDGTETVVNSDSPTWAYIPDTAGEYGFFANGGLNLEEDKPKVAVGSYAEVFAYNDTVVAPYDKGTLGLIMSGDYAEGEVNWVIPSELDTLSALPTDTLEPSVLDLEPISIQPIDLGGSGSVGLMAVPTPNYTDGVWGFNNTQYGTAIVSYSGTAGDIVIPLTVTDGTNTYNVTRLGMGTDAQIFDNATIRGSTITIPSGITAIMSYSFNGCNGFVGSLIIPDTAVTFGDAMFKNCSGFDKLVLSENTRILNNEGFANCSGFDGALYIPAGLSTIRTSCFSGCSGFDSLINMCPSFSELSSNALRMSGVKEILDLGGAGLTTTTAGLNADSVQDYVSALGYVAPVSIHNTIIVEDTSLSATLLKLLPVFMVLAVVIFIGYTMLRPDSEFVQTLKNKL